MTTRIHLAKPGTFRDANGRTVDVTPDVIRELAEGYDPAASPAPLVLGHPADGAPAYGWVQKLDVDEAGELWGDVDQVAPELSDAVAAGRYRNVSISYWPKGAAGSPNGDAPQLRHVGILGAQTPAIKGLKPLAFAGGDEGVVSIEFAETSFVQRILRDIARGFREFIIDTGGTDAADRVIPSHLLDALSDASGDEAPVFSEPTPTAQEPGMPADPKPNDPAVDLAERESKIAAREKEIAEREAQIEAAAAEKRKADAVAFAEAQVEAGILAPAGRETVIALHNRLAAGDDEPVSLSDGASKPLLGAFEDLFKGAAPLVSLAEASPADRASEVDVTSTADLTAAANKLVADGAAVNFTEALRTVEREAQK